MNVTPTLVSMEVALSQKMSTAAFVNQSILGRIVKVNLCKKHLFGVYKKLRGYKHPSLIKSQLLIPLQTEKREQISCPSNDMAFVNTSVMV